MRAPAAPDSSNSPEPLDSHNGGLVTRLKRRWRAFSQASAAEIFSEMIARFLVGLFLGGIACVALVPIIFWPSRRNPRPVFDEISDGDWAKWLFSGVLLAPAIFGALSTMLGAPKAGFKSALGMKKIPAKYQITDGVILIEETEPPTSWLRRVLSGLWEILTWSICCLPGLLILLYGCNAIFSERITGKYGRISYGPTAIAGGWLFVAVGIWLLGEGFHLKTDRPIYRWIGWGLAAACLAKGISVLIAGK